MASSTSWQLGRAGRLRIGWAERPAAPADRLQPRERGWLERLDQRPERRTDWIAGRLGLARLLPPGCPVLARRDGAPVVIGAAWAVSVSHEDGWVAVAARPGAGRVAVDLVPDSAAAAAARAVARVGVTGHPASPTAAWAALECAAKLRALGVAHLLDRRVHMRRAGAAWRIVGLGRPARVVLHRLPGAILALADEP